MTDPPSEFSVLRQRTGRSIDELAGLLGYTSRTLWRYEKGDTAPRGIVLEHLRRMIRTEPTDSASSFRFIDLFAGIGGLRKGFEGIGGECVFTSEWDKYSQKTYRANFPVDKHDVQGDMTQIAEESIPRHDVLLAGFPCQPFSIAGVSKKNSLGREHGFGCETQGNLFFEIVRVLQHHRPAAFLLENVKNLVSHDKGNTFRVIRETLEEDLGYNIQWRVIDAKSFVPQHRERILIAGFREKNDFDFDCIQLPDPLTGPKLATILHPEDGSEIAESPFTEGDLATVSDRYTLSNHLWQYLKDYAEKHRLKGNGFGFGLFDGNDVARTLSARYHKDGSEILIKRQPGQSPRRLTPRECARLMGFDAPGESSFKIPVSDTQAYRQLGNAVVVPVIRAAAQHMAPWIISATQAAGSTYTFPDPQMKLPFPYDRRS